MTQRLLKLVMATAVMAVCTASVQAKIGDGYQESEYTVIAASLPEIQSVDLNLNQYGSVGSMELLESGWWFMQLEATAKDKAYFFGYDAQGMEYVLAEYNPNLSAWTEFAFQLGNVWIDDSYKGTPCKWIEVDLSDTLQYAWMPKYEVQPYIDPNAYVVEVAYNTNTSIDYANFVDTLDDGTILGFYIDYYYEETSDTYYDYERQEYRDTVYVYSYFNSDYALFTGAISNAQSITVPDIVKFEDKTFNVMGSGNNQTAWGYLDLEDASSVTSLTLPATVQWINGNIPSTVTDLHLLNEESPVSYGHSDMDTARFTLWVPKAVLSYYKTEYGYNNYGWTGVTVHYEGWEPKAIIIAVNDTTPSFREQLMEAVGDLTEIDTLYVSGHLENDDMYYFSEMTNIVKLDLSGTDMTDIGNCGYLYKLETVVLPSTIEEVYSSAFDNCTSLSSINLEDVITIGSRAFRYCISLESVDLSSAQSIDYSAFEMTQKYSDSEEAALKTVVLGDNLMTIPSNCFYGCHLDEINFPASLQYIESNAIQYLSADSIIIPEGVTSVGYGNFQDAKILFIPASLGQFRNAIGGDQLTDLYLYGNLSQYSNPYSNYCSQITLHVPPFDVASYQQSNYWSSFGSIVAMDITYDELIVDSYVELTDISCLADKADLTITKGGTLKVNADETLNLGAFIQEQSTNRYKDYYWDGDKYVYYGGVSALIAGSQITADTVVVKLQVPTGRWNFITLPYDVKVSDIQFPEGTLWVIRKYSGEDRAKLTGDTWQNMPNGTTLNAGEGYILHCSNDSIYQVEFAFPAANNTKNNIFAYQDVVKSLNKYDSEFAHNRSWNLVGNPYPAFFDIKGIEHGGVITVYNGDDYHGQYGSGSYTAYSLTDDEFVLMPNQAFFVQCPDDSTSMKFKASGRTIYSEEYYIDDKVHGVWAPTRTSGAQSNRAVYNITLSGDQYKDRARLVINPEAKADYELSCDASKFMSDNADIPQFYIIDGGVRYSIDERPLGDGQFRLGARFGQAGEYTIQLSAKDDMSDEVILVDNENGQQVDLKEGSYSFSAKAGSSEGRFVLLLGGGDGETEVMQATGSVDESPIYDTFGHQIPALQKGVNIINQGGTYQKVLK